jgi:uncharacterized damage-inducible protein DinB
MGGMTSDPYDILLGHNRWANREILKLCAGLSEGEFHKRFEIGPGSLHDTMTHVVGCIDRWADRIGGRELRPSLEGEGGAIPRRTVEELLELNEAACEDFAGVVGRVRPAAAEERVWVFAGQSYRFNVAAAILHVTNHGMHHRGQCMNMLRHSGVKFEDDFSELQWQVMGEP